MEIGEELRRRPVNSDQMVEISTRKICSIKSNRNDLFLKQQQQQNKNKKGVNWLSIGGPV